MIFYFLHITLADRFTLFNFENDMGREQICSLSPETHTSPKLYTWVLGYSFKFSSEVAPPILHQSRVN